MGLDLRPVPSGSGPSPHGSGCGKKPFDLAGHVVAAGPRLCPGADGIGGATGWANDSSGHVPPP
ncbi:unnamed protein product, partial [Gulo gulo]